MKQLCRIWIALTAVWLAGAPCLAAQMDATAPFTMAEVFGQMGYAVVLDAAIFTAALLLRWKKGDKRRKK